MNYFNQEYDSKIVGILQAIYKKIFFCMKNISLVMRTRIL
jgi:hypothetical protein